MASTSYLATGSAALSLRLELIVFLVKHEHDDGFRALHPRVVAYAHPFELRRFLQRFGHDEGHGGLLAVGKIERQLLVAYGVRAAEVSRRIRDARITVGVGYSNDLVREPVVEECAIGQELNVSCIRGRRPMILSGKSFSTTAAGGDISVDAGAASGWVELDDVAASAAVGPDD